MYTFGSEIIKNRANYKKNFLIGGFVSHKIHKSASFLNHETKFAGRKGKAIYANASG